MKTQFTSSLVSTVRSSSAPVSPGGFTLGLDLGDRRHYLCVLDAAGQFRREGPLPNTRPAFQALLAEYPSATWPWKPARTAPGPGKCGLTGWSRSPPAASSTHLYNNSAEMRGF